jgi:hypothetical protein
MQFQIFINDPSFDNDNNPYAKIKLHRYSNMEDEDDIDYE